MGIAFFTHSSTGGTNPTSESMRIDSSGNVGIGTSSPSFKLDVAGNARAAYFALRSNESAPAESAFMYRPATGVLGFGTGTAERMRITSSGNLLVNNTYDGFNSNIVAYASGSGSQERSFTAWNGGGTGSYYFFCVNSAGQGIGSITQNGTNQVQYNISSDYRLKENVEYDWDATTRLKQLKPARFNFIADADTTFDGFLAHEVSSIVPEAIHGEKDEVDAEGNPKYQGIDQSKLVPLLVKTIQELEARITALENA
jgi:hypothetical protein